MRKANFIHAVVHLRYCLFLSRLVFWSSSIDNFDEITGFCAHSGVQVCLNVATIITNDDITNDIRTCIFEERTGGKTGGKHGNKGRKRLKDNRVEKWTDRTIEVTGGQKAWLERDGNGEEGESGKGNGRVEKGRMEKGRRKWRRGEWKREE